jgi:hypothetical protein
LIALSKVKSLAPSLVDEQIPGSFGLGSLWPERIVNRVIAEAIDIVATGKADVVSS